MTRSFCWTSAAEPHVYATMSELKNGQPEAFASLSPGLGKAMRTFCGRLRQARRAIFTKMLRQPNSRAPSAWCTTVRCGRRGACFACSSNAHTASPRRVRPQGEDKISEREREVLNLAGRGPLQPRNRRRTRHRSAHRQGACQPAHAKGRSAESHRLVGPCRHPSLLVHVRCQGSGSRQPIVGAL